MAQSRLQRISFWWFLTLGLTALAAGILVYLLLLESALGAFSIRDASPAMLGSQSGPRVALLESDYTKRSDPTANVWVGQTVSSWRDFLLDRNRTIPFTTINDNDLELNDLSNYDVLILPSSSAMSDAQIRSVKEFMQNGGSVLATWTPGIYDQSGNWRGWTFIEEVFGVAFEGFVDRGGGNYRIYQDTFPGTSPTGLYMPNRSLDGRFTNTTSFSPLRGYTWVDTVTTTLPQTDFAVARSVTVDLRDISGQLRLQDGMEVTYYTWIGGDPEDQVPFPRTGPGIRRFTLRGNTPLTANIPSGYRGKVQVYNEGVKVRVLEPRTKPAGFWFDFATENQVVTEALENTTGIVYGTYGTGRFVYMGFQRDAFGVGREDEEDWKQLGIFFSNVMDFLRRRPISWVHDWPHRPVGQDDFIEHTAGAMISGIGESQVQNLRIAADVLGNQGIPGTYFVRPEAASAHADLLRGLHRSGDVGVLGDPLHNSDGSRSAQAAELGALKDALEATLGIGEGDKPVTGYRSTKRGMYGTLRDTLISYTMAGLSDAGYRYFLPDSVGRRTVPKQMGSPYDALTRIGVSARSDRALNRLAAAQGTNSLWEGFFLDDIARVKHEGSLYNLIYSSDLLGTPANKGTLESIVRTLRAENFWFASGDQVRNWWVHHRRLSTDVEQRGPSRVFVRISNDNGSTVENATVSIALNRPVPPRGTIRIRPELIDVLDIIPNRFDLEAENPPFKLSEDGTVVVLGIDRLEPGKYRIFHIDILNAEGQPLLTDD